MAKEIRVSVDCEVYGFHKLFTEKKDVFAFLEEMFDEDVTGIVIKKTRHERRKIVKLKKGVSSDDAKYISGRTDI